jgi:hypothetical protein
MEQALLPGTDERVPRNTAASINDRIHARTLHDISRYVGADPVFIDERIRELERVERALESNASAVILAGIGLSLVNRKFLAVPVVAAAFLLQHALQG